MAEDLVLYECADRIATISLNRPEKLNAVSDDVVAQLADALRRFDIDAEADVAILCGKGRACRARSARCRETEHLQERAG